MTGEKKGFEFMSRNKNSSNGVIAIKITYEIRIIVSYFGIRQGKLIFDLPKTKERIPRDFIRKNECKKTILSR